MTLQCHGVLMLQCHVSFLFSSMCPYVTLLQCHVFFLCNSLCPYVTMPCVMMYKYLVSLWYNAMCPYVISKNVDFSVLSHDYFSSSSKVRERATLSHSIFIFLLSVKVWQFLMKLGDKTKTWLSSTVPVTNFSLKMPTISTFLA